MGEKIYLSEDFDEEPLLPAEKKRKEREKRWEEENKQLVKEYTEAGNDWMLRFLLQWTLLSGGTLTLLVTFAQSSHSHQAWYGLFRLSSGLLISSVVLSTLLLFMRGKAFHHSALSIRAEVWKTNYWAKISNWCLYVPIFLYIVAIFFAWIFVDSNLRIG